MTGGIEEQQGEEFLLELVFSSHPCPKLLRLSRALKLRRKALGVSRLLRRPKVFVYAHIVLSRFKFDIDTRHEL